MLVLNTKLIYRYRSANDSTKHETRLQASICKCYNTKHQTRLQVSIYNNNNNNNNNNKC